MMLIAILTYTKSLDAVDRLVPPHRVFLKELFDEQKLLLAGRLNPRTGGVIIAKNISRTEFEQILQRDPLHQVSEYKILEITPVFFDECLQWTVE